MTNSHKHISTPTQIFLNQLLKKVNDNMEPKFKYVIDMSSKINQPEYFKSLETDTTEYLTDLGLRQSYEPKYYVLNNVSFVSTNLIHDLLKQLEFRDELVSEISIKCNIDISDKPFFDWRKYVHHYQKDSRHICHLIHYTGNLIGSLSDVNEIIKVLELYPKLYNEKSVNGYLINLYTGVMYAYHKNGKCVDYFTKASSLNTSVVYEDAKFDKFFALFRILVARIKKLDEANGIISDNIKQLNKLTRDFGENDSIFLKCVITNLECLWLLKNGKNSLVHSKLEKAWHAMKNLKLKSLTMDYEPALAYKIQLRFNMSYFYLLKNDFKKAKVVLKDLKKITVNDDDFYYSVMVNTAYVELMCNQYKLSIKRLKQAEKYYLPLTQPSMLELIYKCLYIAFSGSKQHNEANEYFQKFNFLSENKMKNNEVILSENSTKSYRNWYI